MSHQEKGHNLRGRSHPKPKFHGGKKPYVGEKAKQILENIDINSPVIKSFQQYSAELDAKHDKYERIVKISRDITIESKRIIFLLHSLDRESKAASILDEAEKRLSQLARSHFQSVAKELHGEDPFQFLRAYTAGLQEYTEAITFYYYLKCGTLQPWNIIQSDLIYKEDEIKEDQIKEDPKAEYKENSNLESKKDSENKTEAVTVQTLVPQMEYILGVADLTGELMRKCINNLGSGNIEGCYQTCKFVREIYTGFLGVTCSGFRELSRKLTTLKQSLGKMENACYTIHVRGSEIPKHMLADVLSGNQEEFIEEDEGFY